MSEPDPKDIIEITDEDVRALTGWGYNPDTKELVPDLMTPDMAAKFNPHHDEHGKFAESDSGGAAAQPKGKLMPKPGVKVSGIPGKDAEGNKLTPEQSVKDVIGEGYTPDDMAALVGAPEGSKVWVEALYEPVPGSDGMGGSGSNAREIINVHTDSEWYTVQSRYFYRDDDGKLVVDNSLFILKDDAPAGLGTKVLADEVSALREVGGDRIETDAARGPSMVGYYVWPRLGFDAPLDMKQQSMLAHAGMGQVSHVSDLMKTAKGRAWWKENGVTRNMTFDVKKGSLSNRILEAYMKEKGYKRAKLDKPLGLGEGIDLTESDLEILDRIWDTIDNPSVLSTKGLAMKTVGSIANDYMDELNTLLASLADGASVNSVVQQFNELVQDYAQEVYAEGMSEGGVDDPENDLSDDDQNAIDTWVDDQQSHVDSFVSDVKDDAGEMARVSMWGNALTVLGAQGRASAEGAKMVTWQMGENIEAHCSTCQSLDGERHRLDWFLSQGFIPREPGSETLECQGYKCGCSLVDDDGNVVM